MAFFDGPQATGPVDPNTYAQQYATQNGISLDEAKEQLKARFGDPQKPNSTFTPNDTIPNVPASTLREPVLKFSGPNTNFNYNPLGAIGANQEQLEAYVKKGAKQTGMTEQEFVKAVGLPPREKPQEDKTQILKDLGIPQNIINKGDDAIRKYAKDHNINLPAKNR